MQRINDYLNRGMETERLTAALQSEGNILVRGLSGSRRAVLVAALCPSWHCSLVVATGEKQVDTWLDDLRTLLPGADVLYFPADDWDTDYTSSADELGRQEVFGRLGAKSDKPLVIVTTSAGISYRVQKRPSLDRYTLKLTVGDRLPLTELFVQLAEHGYERSAHLPEPGFFTVRGGIIDIVPGSGEPVRLEFFDDELDSIRYYDLRTQLSTQSLQEVKLLPAGDLMPRGKRDGAEQLTPFWSFLPLGSLVLLEEPARIRQQMLFRRDELWALLAGPSAKVTEKDLPVFNLVDYEEWFLVSGLHVLGISALIEEAPGFGGEGVDLLSRSLPVFSRTAQLAADVRDFLAQGYAVVILGGGEKQIAGLSQGLRDLDIEVEQGTWNSEFAAGKAVLLPDSLSDGFVLPTEKFVLYTELEVWQKRRRHQALKVTTREKQQFFADIKPGDLIVHHHHGVGRYMGIETIEVEGLVRDFFLINYAGEDKLFVPLDQLQCLEKYVGAGEAQPRLSRLNSGEWNKAKSKAQSAVKEMAIDLVALYASREQEKGFAFGEDTDWQREFEEKFPYVETPDQEQCIWEIKADMQRTRPMDRLLCGDAGYGKTEVALRAVFKAVENGKQVAMLVPTTILAQQHYNTMLERFEGYPFAVEMLSRFRSAAEQKVILEGLKKGQVDIVVGTHRLLSEQVVFRDLGLLIIDEEQRFGVASKEKLKDMKKTVDVLTMTATPIPRTLHMSMAGIRDISVINTPPEERLPVRTFVTGYNPTLVQGAIRRELERGGQVFYVHNRVHDLSGVWQKLVSAVPEARYGLVHGQMDEQELEREMLLFLAGKKDVMICTTIIETGLDMPNVNTLIVEDADRFGLAQLYQLRGRVGRSSRRATAYFFCEPHKILTEDAEKRLSTIREFTDLGAGYQIALRDLEIRGAGNLIGGEQHGHMQAVGYTTYMRLLRDAVEELKGGGEPPPPEPVIDLKVEALLPDDYVGDPREKVRFYQRMVELKEEASVSDFVDELIDRCGQLPAPAENLVRVLRLKNQARLLGIGELSQKQNRLEALFVRDPALSGEQFLRLADSPGLPLTFKVTPQGDGLKVLMPLHGTESRLVLQTAEKLLNLLTREIPSVVI
jgi:transcription-repair coupling factor (superfamily II helicase)